MERRGSGEVDYIKATTEQLRKARNTIHERTMKIVSIEAKNASLKVAFTEAEKKRKTAENKISELSAENTEKMNDLKKTKATLSIQKEEISRYKSEMHSAARVLEEKENSLRSLQEEFREKENTLRDDISNLRRAVNKFKLESESQLRSGKQNNERIASTLEEISSRFPIEFRIWLRSLQSALSISSPEAIENFKYQSFQLQNGDDSRRSNNSRASTPSKRPLSTRLSTSLPDRIFAKQPAHPQSPRPSETSPGGMSAISRLSVTKNVASWERRNAFLTAQVKDLTNQVEKLTLQKIVSPGNQLTSRIYLGGARENSFLVPTPSPIASFAPIAPRVLNIKTVNRSGNSLSESADISLVVRKSADSPTKRIIAGKNGNIRITSKLADMP